MSFVFFDKEKKILIGLENVSLKWFSLLESWFFSTTLLVDRFVHRSETEDESLVFL